MTDSIHPQFLALHAVLTDEPELLAMHEGGVPLHTILKLYPVDPLTYLPYFRRRFAYRNEQVKADVNWAMTKGHVLYSWDTRRLLEMCTGPTDEKFPGDYQWPSPMAELIAAASMQAPENELWHRSNLGFEVRDVMNLATRLSQWQVRRYELMPRRQRKDVLTQISSLPSRALANIGETR